MSVDRRTSTVSPFTAQPDCAERTAPSLYASCEPGNIILPPQEPVPARRGSQKLFWAMGGKVTRRRQKCPEGRKSVRPRKVFARLMPTHGRLLLGFLMRVAQNHFSGVLPAGRVPLEPGVCFRRPELQWKPPVAQADADSAQYESDHSGGRAVDRELAPRASSWPAASSAFPPLCAGARSECSVSIRAALWAINLPRQ